MKKARVWPKSACISCISIGIDGLAENTIFARSTHCKFLRTRGRLHFDVFSWLGRLLLRPVTLTLSSNYECYGYSCVSIFCLTACTSIYLQQYAFRSWDGNVRRFCTHRPMYKQVCDIDMICVGCVQISIRTDSLMMLCHAECVRRSVWPMFIVPELGTP